MVFVFIVVLSISIKTVSERSNTGSQNEGKWILNPDKITAFSKESRSRVVNIWVEQIGVLNRLELFGSTNNLRRGVQRNRREIKIEIERSCVELDERRIEDSRIFSPRSTLPGDINAIYIYNLSQGSYPQSLPTSLPGSSPFDNICKYIELVGVEPFWFPSTDVFLGRGVNERSSPVRWRFDSKR
jgi:hypothetical protein